VSVLAVLAAAVALAAGWFLGSHFSRRGTAEALTVEEAARAASESRDIARINERFNSSLAEAGETREATTALARWRAAAGRLSRP
jgi:hypothetical protein